ncbi:MAG TPA: LuxR C-terminal-related transcriptional regulator [Solirubrobacteraceae bacterium]|nr:LuxR C-terminal-related transcriptional regulator [Solirubrobacteraceae bacterium]
MAATKLHIPALRAGHLHRAQLVGALIANGQSRVALVAAAPGSGKTSLLAEWHADTRESRPFAWISLDAADNDPVRFWDGVFAALQTTDQAIGGSAQAALHSPGTTVTDQVLPLLINDLAELAGPVVLVLDDYHLIENGEIHAAIELLVERLPATAQLVISTRSDPPLPLSRLRARGQLIEIRGGDLRFNVAEAGAFLNDVVGLDLESDEIARLHERTEGWAAGLQLAGLSLRGREDHRQFIDSFAGDDQHIVEYLGFEVLDNEPTELREFMIQTSILERLSGHLCTAVTGSPDSERLLQRLERENAFVIAVDSRREWYRYHHLFAELLRHELTRTSPGLVVELHRRASAWYRDAGAIHEAIEHATAAGDFGDAIELITTHWYEFLQRGRQETVASWIDQLPSETVVHDPNLCLTKAWLGVNNGRLDDVDRWIEVAGRASVEQPQAEELPPLESGVASLRAIHRYMSGNVSAAVAAGRRALELERGGPASPWRPVGCPVLGLSLHWHGEHEDASRTLIDAVRIARANGNHLAAMHASGGLAAIEYERGDAASANARAAEAIALAEEHDLAEHWASSLSLAVRGQLLARADDPEAADQVLLRASELARRGVASIEIAYTLLALAGVRQRLGRRDEAHGIYEEARKAVATCEDPGILSTRLARAERHTTFAPRPRANRASGRSDALSEAELSVLRLLRSELSQREIAGELHLSFNTIKTHTRNIYRKLGVAERTEAISRARELSLI